MRDRIGALIELSVALYHLECRTENKISLG